MNPVLLTKRECHSWLDCVKLAALMEGLPVFPHEHVMGLDLPTAASTKLPAQRPYGPAAGYFLVVASMVGSGILTTSGFTLKDTGNPAALMFLWFLGGLVALSGALVVAELSTRIPHVGGDYLFVKEAFGPAVGGMAGWATFLVGFAAPTAVIANQAANYLLAPCMAALGEKALFLTRLAATLLILGIAAVHCMGSQQSSTMQIGSTVLKLALLIAFVFAGLASTSSSFSHWSASHVPTWQQSTVLFQGMVYVGYAYTGWNAASYLAGEIRQPHRSLPWCLVGGTITVMLLYLLVNIVYVQALPVQLMMQASNDQVARVAEMAAVRLFGTQAANGLSLLLGLSLIASVSAYLLAGPRVVLAMSRDGVFPAAAGRLHKQFKTPAIATLLQALAASGLVWASTFRSLLDSTSAGLAVVSALVVASIFPLRAKRVASMESPVFLAPWHPLFPAFFLLINVCLIGKLLQDSGSRWPVLFGLLALLPGAIWGSLHKGARTAVETQA